MLGGGARLVNRTYPRSPIRCGCGPRAAPPSASLPPLHVLAALCSTNTGVRPHTQRERVSAGHATAPQWLPTPHHPTTHPRCWLATPSGPPSACSTAASCAAACPLPARVTGGLVSPSLVPATRCRLQHGGWRALLARVLPRHRRSPRRVHRPRRPPVGGTAARGSGRLQHRGRQSGAGVIVRTVAAATPAVQPAGAIHRGTNASPHPNTPPTMVTPLFIPQSRTRHTAQPRARAASGRGLQDGKVSVCLNLILVSGAAAALITRPCHRSKHGL